DEGEGFRARLRLTRVTLREHRVEQRREERGRIGRDDDHSAPATRQLPTWIPEQQVHDGRDEEAADDAADRVRECRMTRVAAHRPNSAAIASPDSWAFGTKPQAPQSPLQRP